MVASLRIYWKAHHDRNRELTEEDGCPVNLMEVQDPTKANTVGNLKIEDRVNTKLDHFAVKIRMTQIPYKFPKLKEKHKMVCKFLLYYRPDKL